MPVYNLSLNGKTTSVTAAEDMPLLWVLRDLLHLRGTKYGCGLGICGSCTLLVDGEATQSCLMPIRLAEGKQITTIEGLSTDGDHLVQEAWKAAHVPQCGYCQSGQIMQATALLAANPNPTAEEIAASMSKILCRCGTYPRIKNAIALAAKKTQ